jgi:catechol 2,3-dioxygenase-like lactoylglutathione lyase family enzyme
MSNLALVALVVRDYDPAIRFFVDVLGFELVEDVPSLTNDGRPKRWVVVRPPGGTASTNRKSSAVSSPGALASSCVWTTSMRPTTV